MSHRVRLLAAMLLAAVLPMLLLNRYAFAFFHHYSKTALEKSMVHSARLAADLFAAEMDPALRADLLAAHAAATESRIRFWDAERRLLLDTGESPGLDPRRTPDVDRAFATGRYAAHWELTADRRRVYYFAAWPLSDPAGGDILGVAQVLRHTESVTAALLRMKEHQTRATWITAGLSALLALLLALLLGRRLRGLQKAARRYAETGDSAGFDLGGRDEFTALALSFRSLADALEKRQAYNRDFVVTTLHELKTPLTAIRGAAELLRRPELAAADRQRFGENIHTQALRLQRLVEELRALTSLDVDLPRETPEAAAAGPLLAKILDRIRPALAHPVLFADAESALTLHVRPQRLEQALVNLLENADRHSPPDRPVEVALRAEGDLLRILVRDHGPGIPPENEGRIFEPFFTTLPRGGHPQQGLGLGLAVAQSIARAHGGRVEAAPAPDGGSIFSILLPLFPSSSLSSKPHN